MFRRFYKTEPHSVTEQQLINNLIIVKTGTNGII
jgi:hypothetical protein